jgi:CHAT domain-containing protein
MLSVMNDPDNPQWADPVYWAPFVLVGEPGFER